MLQKQNITVRTKFMFLNDMLYLDSHVDVMHIIKLLQKCLELSLQKSLLTENFSAPTYICIRIHFEGKNMWQYHIEIINECNGITWFWHKLCLNKSKKHFLQSCLLYNVALSFKCRLLKIKISSFLSI